MYRFDDYYKSSALAPENEHLWEGYGGDGIKPEQVPNILSMLSDDVAFNLAIKTLMQHKFQYENPVTRVDNSKFNGRGGSKIITSPDTWAYFVAGLEASGVKDKQDSRILGPWLQVLYNWLTLDGNGEFENSLKQLFEIFSTHSREFIEYIFFGTSQISPEVMCKLKTIGIPESYFKVVAERVREAHSANRDGLLLNEIDLSTPVHGTELMLGRNLEYIPHGMAFPELEQLENVDLFNGIEVEYKPGMFIRARLVHPTDIQSIETVARMRGAGYAKYGAEAFKKTRAESINPEKAYLCLIEVGRKNSAGDIVRIPQSTITVEYGGEVEGERPLTETLRLMSPKSILDREWNFYTLIWEKLGVTMEQYANGEAEGIHMTGLKELRSEDTLEDTLGLARGTFKHMSEIESLAFFDINEDTWAGVLDGSINIPDTLPDKPKANIRTFGFEYITAILVVGEATRRYGAKAMGAMLQPKLSSIVSRATGVEIDKEKAMVLNPLRRNKPAHLNGTSLNLDYFLHFYPYFLKSFVHKCLGMTKPLESINIEERERLDELLKDKATKIAFELELIEFILDNEPEDLGPIMVLVDQQKYMAALIKSINLMRGLEPSEKIGERTLLKEA